jgi:hypothetical protein
MTKIRFLRRRRYIPERQGQRRSRATLRQWIKNIYPEGVAQRIWYNAFSVKRFAGHRVPRVCCATLALWNLARLRLKPTDESWD